MTRVIPDLIGNLALTPSFPTRSGISHLLRHSRPDRETGTTVIPDPIGNLNKNKNE